MTFGETLREAVNPIATLDAFRRDASVSVDRAVIENVTARLAERIRDEPTRAVLIDSHAVSPTLEGLRATPDTPTRLAAFRYSVIVHLSVTGAEERVVRNSEREGRTTLPAEQVATAEMIQVSVVSGYASLCDCPLYVVSADGAVPEVAERIHAAVRAGLRWSDEYARGQ